MSTVFAKRYRIPVVANVVAVAACSVLYFLLLYMASRATTASGVIISGMLFAVVMIPVYSLIHEAEHNMLLSNPRWNDIFGRWLCALFIVSFTFFKHCHLRHHRKNRTDIEIWDLYLEHQVKWKRYGNLYLMMSGLGYFLIWLSVVLFAVAPSLLYNGFFQRHTEIAGFLEGSNQEGKLRAIRWGCWVVLVFQAAVFFALQLSFMPWPILFAIHGFVWSSQNYVNHAFSPRDIINGAHNLKMPIWLKPIYMNFNLHLAHHQNPHIPWIHLPNFVQSLPNRMSFFYNYLRLWSGPRLTREKSPLLGTHAAD
jgi:fatty acid desaturase